MEKSLFNIGQAVVYTGLFNLGEKMQELSSKGLINYNWFTGHLSDLALGSITAGGLLTSKIFFKDNKYLNFASTLLPPVIATIDELKVLNIDPNTSTYDPQDIACFFAGSLMAYGLSKANEKGIFDKTSQKLKNLFKKKTLENLATQ